MLREVLSRYPNRSKSVNIVEHEVNEVLLSESDKGTSCPPKYGFFLPDMKGRDSCSWDIQWPDYRQVFFFPHKSVHY